MLFTGVSASHANEFDFNGYAFDEFTGDLVNEIAQYLEAIHTENDGTISKPDMFTFDETCKNCHGPNFIDDITVTGARTNFNTNLNLPPFTIRPLNLTFGGVGGGSEEESCEDTPGQQKAGATGQAGQCTPPPSPLPEGERPCSRDFLRDVSGNLTGPYLNYDDFQSSDAWATIGGSLGDHYGNLGSNSCAARLSYGLNCSGSVIPSAPGSNLTFGGPNNGSRFIISARRLRTYITNTWGNADPNLTGISVATLRGRLAPGQVAIYLANGHSGVVTATYNDGFTGNGDFWLLPVCP